MWIWQTDDGEDYYFDTGDVVRVRVEAEIWQDQAPKGPLKNTLANSVSERNVPYAITVSATNVC